MNLWIIILIACSFFAIIVLFLYLLGKIDVFSIEPTHRRAGRAGEHFITGLIQEVLWDEDVLLTNVELSFDGKPTEIDNLIINSNGVFIIEAKNYSGILYGTEADYEWTKVKISEGGQMYQKMVKNPIKQVNRQIYILANKLKQAGVEVWVEGFVFLVERNSPVDSPYVLSSRREIDEAIHTRGQQRLSPREIRRIQRILCP